MRPLRADDGGPGVLVAGRSATAVVLVEQHGVAAHRASRIRRTHRRCRSGGGESVHHLCRRRVRRHLQERQQRRDVETGLRQGRHVAVDRRSRDCAIRSKCDLGGNGRAQQPAELVVGRRCLQIGGRRRNLDAHGSPRHAPRRPHRHSPVESKPRLRRGARSPLGPKR